MRVRICIHKCILGLTILPFTHRINGHTPATSVSPGSTCTLKTVVPCPSILIHRSIIPSSFPFSLLAPSFSLALLFFGIFCYPVLSCHHYILPLFSLNYLFTSSFSFFLLYSSLPPFLPPPTLLCHSLIAFRLMLMPPSLFTPIYNSNITLLLSHTKMTFLDDPSKPNAVCTTMLALSVSISFCLYLSIYLSLSLSLFFSISLYLSLFLYLSVSISLYLSLYLYLSAPLFSAIDDLDCFMFEHLHPGMLFLPPSSSFSLLSFRCF